MDNEIGKKINSLIAELINRSDGATDIAGCLKLVERLALSGAGSLRARLEYNVRGLARTSIKIVEEDSRLKVIVGELNMTKTINPETREIARRGYDALVRFAGDYEV